MTKIDNTYWLVMSNKTMWERNDNFVLSAPALSGPWTRRGLLAPAGTLTHNSQCSYILRLHTDQYVYMGDRWSFPHQASAATQVWLPLQINATGIALPALLPEWSLGGEVYERRSARVPVDFRARTRGEFVEVPFSGAAVEVVGATAPDCSYGLIEVLDRGEPVVSQLVDWYSLVPGFGVRWVSPPLAAREYTLRVTATGERPEWFKKDGTRFGPVDSHVNVSHITVHRR